MQNQYVQYIVLRRNLINQYGVGFLVTQTAHASLAPITNKIRNRRSSSIDDILDNDTLNWIEGTFTKIVLEVPDETSLNKLKESLNKDGIEFSEIRESSIGGELTSIGLRPYKKSEVYKYFRGLRLLK